MRRILLLSCLFASITLLGSFSSGPAQAQDNVAVFMKAKLTHSQQVLKGLATEDFDLIAKSAQAMSLLCEDEIWMVLQTPEYRERSAEFRRSVDAEGRQEEPGRRPWVMSTSR
jgi:hypothetical protein